MRSCRPFSSVYRGRSYQIDSVCLPSPRAPPPRGSATYCCSMPSLVPAAVMTAPNMPVEVREIPAPKLEPGGAMLRTMYSEVCGTDVHLYHGRLAGVPYPIVPGHVSVGRVIDSKGVTRDATGEPLTVGDVVTFYDVHEVCNACWHCLVARQPNRCPSRKVYGMSYFA